MSEKPTLALNMIVGPGEHVDLDRCLRSFKAKETFDELVIVNTSNDKQVDEVIAKWGAKTAYHPWTSERYPFGNFAAARNVALDMTESTWVMWLDADDVCLSTEHREKLAKMHDKVTSEEAQSLDVFFMRYVLIVDEHGNELAPFMRDRIFKRQEAFRWKNAVHENITPPLVTIKSGTINGISITHMPAKSGHASCFRNIKILEHELANGDESSQVRYFLARDLACVGRIDESIALTKKMFTDRICEPDHMYGLLMTIAHCVGYGGGTPIRPALDLVPEGAVVQVESLLRQAISLDTSRPEPYVLLADLYVRRGELAAARNLYSMASKKARGSSRIVSVDTFYDELPAARLADMNMYSGELDAALFYNRIALKVNPHEEKYWHQRKAILDTLCAETAQVFAPPE